MIVKQPTRLILVRHGQSMANAEQRVQGWADDPLSPLGVQQATHLAAWLRQHDAAIDQLVSSPLQRAHQTAVMLGNALGLAVEHHSGLREFGLGLLEDQPEAVLQAALQAGDIVETHGAEAMPVFADRIVTALHEILDRHAGKTILVTAHLGVISTALAHWLDQNIGVAWAKYGRIPNTSITELAIHTKFELVRHAATPHLPAYLIPEHLRQR